MKRDIKNLLKIITNPIEAFVNLKEKPNCFLPIVCIIVGTITIAFLTFPFAAQIVRHSIPAGLDEKQIEIRLKVVKIMSYISLILTPFILIISWIVKSLLIWLISQLFDGAARFKQVFSIICHTAIITFFKEIFALFLIYLKGPERITKISDIQFAWGLDAFTSPDKVSFPLYTFLSHINVFSIWYVVVLTLGIAMVNEFQSF